MKVTVGGSYHEPGWTHVCNLIKKLKQSGHEVLAPGSEWTPINKNDSFIKFQGQENKSIKELQDSFFDAMAKSDAYIICNPNSYEGFAVSVEIGYASALLMHKNSNLKQMYFMEPPLGYEIFRQNPKIELEEFEHEVMNNPVYENELNYYKKCLGATGGISYTQMSDFYADIKDLVGKIMVLEKMGLATIGLDSILTYKEKEDEERM